MTTLGLTQLSPSVQDEVLLNLQSLPLLPLPFKATMSDRAPTPSKLPAQDSATAMDQPDLAAQFAALKLQLDEERTRRENAEAKALESEKKQRESEKKQLESEKKQYKLEKEQRMLIEDSRKTTFEELLELCHTHLSLPVVIEEPAKSTKGATTMVEGKYRPSHLHRWSTFPTQRHDFFMKTQSFFAKNAPVARFSSRSEIRGHAEYTGMNLSSESDLEKYHDGAVERAVRVIVEKLCLLSEAQQHFNLGHGFIFEGNTNRFSNNDREVQDRRPDPNADRYGTVYRKTETGEKGEVIFILEYKPAHKMTLPILREGVKNMELDDIVNNPRRPTDSEKAFTQHAEEFVAKVTTQIYDYMLKSGIEYGCIATGEALVFVRIDYGSLAQTLYYHLAEPKFEYAHSGSAGAPAVSLTAVAQLLSFTLIAFGASYHNQEARTRALRDANVWSKDDAKLLRKKSDPQLISSPPSSAYKGKSYRITTSPPMTRSRSRQANAQSCKVEGEGTPQDNGSDFEDDGSHDSPSRHREQPGSCAQHALASRPKRHPGSEAQNEHHDKQNTRRTAHDFDYCTESCLLGLTQNQPLDPDCPNYHMHQQHSESKGHPISIASALHLIKQQLHQDLDDHCIDLKKQGARGMLFKIALMPFSYCFVGKGTRDVFVPDLKHEGRMYQHMREMQARHIPVHLGNIDMSRPWYGLGFEIIHMLLLSFAGSHYPALWGEDWSQEEKAAWKQGIRDFVAEANRLGIQHNDLEHQNIMYHAKLGCSRIIDFERSSFIKKHVLPKRRHEREAMEIFEDPQESAAEAQAPPSRTDDRSVLEAIPVNATLIASAQLDVAAKTQVIDSVNPLKPTAVTAKSTKTMDSGPWVETSDSRSKLL